MRTYALLALALIACGKTPSETQAPGAEFALLPDVGQLDYALLAAEASADSIELRQNLSSGDASVVRSSGTPCATATDQAACKAKLASLTSLSGFQNRSCLPLDCAKYVVATRGDEVLAARNAVELATLFNRVSTREEAALFVAARDYDTGGTITDSAYRATADGYEIIATKLTSDCAPVTISRFHLSVNVSGDVQILSQEVVSSTNECI